VKAEFALFYGGPNQILALPSLFASIAGLALMFWNRVLILFGKIAGRLRQPRPGASASMKNESPQVERDRR
jgi:hypothetical protein